MQKLIYRRNGLKISKEYATLLLIFCVSFILIILPDGIKNMFCVYKMSTRDLPLVYTYNYYFTIFDFLIIIVGLFFYKRSKIIRCMPIVAAIVAINLIRWIVGASNVIDLNSYEMILMILESVCWSSIILYFFNNEEKVSFLLTLFVIITVLTQIVQFILGNFSVDGRVSAISLGPGATAEILIKYELWFLLCYNKENKSYVPFIISVLGLVLTGSRANMLALALIFILFSFQIWKQSKDTKTRWKLSALILIIALGIVALFSINTSFDFINRFTALFENDLSASIVGDSSYYGRMRSIIGGFEMWKENPFGIACSIYDVEYRSYKMVTMEYPHSGLLCYILLWSPLVTIPIYIYLIKLLHKLWKYKDTSWILMGFILIKYLILSAAILYVSIYSLDIILFSYFLMRLNKKKNL